MAGLFRVLGWTIGLGLVAIAILFLFFVHRVRVSHNAMAPTLLAGEEALVWRNADIEMGDVVVCEHPGRRGEFVIGRVVAKPGMRIESPRGQLTVSDTRADVDYQGTVRFYDTVLDRTDTMRSGVETLGNTEHRFFIRKDDHLRIRPTEVSKGPYLLADNRSVRGNDSRQFGPVDVETCIGQVFMRLWPNDDDPNDLGHGYLEWIE